jgi:membrane associated rhomboid family serine protease
MRFFARILSIVVGAITLGFVFYKLIGPVGHWYELNFAKSDDDLGQAYMVALAVQLVALLAGGLLGDWAFRRWQHKRLSRRKLP